MFDDNEVVRLQSINFGCRSMSVLMRIASAIVIPKKIYHNDVGMSRPDTLPDVSKR
jgi:hypothetical protein